MSNYSIKGARDFIATIPRDILADQARHDFVMFQDWVVSHMGCAHQEFASALGIAGEAGEVADLIKKHLCHGLPLDRSKLVKELGDVLHYIASVGAQHGISMREILRANVDKIEARYPNGFSTEAAAARADEAPSAGIPDTMPAAGGCNLPSELPPGRHAP